MRYFNKDIEIVIKCKTYKLFTFSKIYNYYKSRPIQNTFLYDWEVFLKEFLGIGIFNIKL